MSGDDFKNFTREQLVTEYIEGWIAECSFTFDGKFSPSKRITDMNPDPNYWKRKLTCYHDMHLEIARRYHLDYENIKWLNYIQWQWGTELYLAHGSYKAIIAKCIKELEKQEAQIPKPQKRGRK